MRVIGLDVGGRRIGVAVSDPLGISAQGVEVYERRGMDNDLEHFCRLADQWQAGLWVLGMPVNMNGTRGEKALAMEEFGRALEEATGIPVRYMDERLTTVAAHKALIEGGTRRKARKQVVDRLAAQLILQTWMDSHPRGDQ
jgi:putative Holliday junction resolvase